MNLNQLFTQTASNSSSNVGVQQQQQQQARINYCTICNKELCNKYFMKTHMLKMHGINLEMDTSSSGSNYQDEQEHQQQEDQPEDCSDWKRRKDSFSTQLPADLSLKSSSKSKPAATSVMNGFAGNSMGGVICDICNKELCSKYFLKVHKQNTHGIATDNYAHDPSSNPFAAAAAAAAIYPFASLPFPLPLAAAAGGQLALPGQSPFHHQQPASQPPAAGSFQFDLAAPTVAAVDQQKPRPSNKKIRLDNQTSHRLIEQPGQKLSDDGQSQQAPPTTAGQLESLYRLMIAQQHQQQQHPAAHAEDPMAAVAAAAAAAAAMSPLSALMCFGGSQQGAAAAFMGPASLSPAMIVDQILRNQHLFSSQHKQQQQTNKLPNSTKSTPDRNNNNNNNGDQSKKQQQSGSSSNKRYFSHYTEACPMCDRRFKSIKWLKTHMMNDHKHEIGVYMQSMMQYFYQTSKSQQLAAAASMANAFEPTFQQQQQQQQQYSLQANQLMSIFNQQQQQQQQQLNLPTSQAPPFVDHTAQQQQYQRAMYEAQCQAISRRDLERKASLSPTDSLSNHHQPQIKRESSSREEEEGDLDQRRPSCPIIATVQNSESALPDAASLNLNFELNDDRDTLLSGSPPSPGPTLALDSQRRHESSSHSSSGSEAENR